jgi:hypothetical protein
MMLALWSRLIKAKANINHTESIGHDLGIIAASNTVEHLIPEYTVTLELGATGYA